MNSRRYGIPAPRSPGGSCGLLALAIATAVCAGGRGVRGQAVDPVNVAEGAAREQAPNLPATAPSTMPASAPAAEVPAPATSVASPTTAPSSPTTAPSSAAAPLDDGPAYPITELKIDYLSPHPQQPPLGDLLNREIRLGLLNDGYVAPRPGVPTAAVKLGELGKLPPHTIYRSAIKQCVYPFILDYLRSKGLIGVFVVVDAGDIDANDRDLRGGRTTLQLIIVTSTVKQVRTVELGQTAKDAERVDIPRHAFIRQHSPIQPSTEPAGAQADGGERRFDLLKKDALDDYVLRLNRQPGRRVDVAVSGTGEPGKVYLDYLVAENRPWYAYAQVSNTGTKQTSVWRERFGFVDNQLTGHDDVLSLDYSTSGFSDSHAVVASYELPFLDLERVRFKAYGSWDQYTASDVGQSTQNFTGESWTGGGEWIANIFQHHRLFLDLAAGTRFQTENTTGGAQGPGEGDFTEPYLSLRMDRSTDIMATTASLTLVDYLGSGAQSGQNSLDALGRLNTSRDAAVLQFDFGHSFFLEPVIDTARFADGQSTLAHEVYIGARGQWAFNSRMTPAAQDVAGGLYSVRGYPEAIVSGDSVIVATAEYRFHVPRIFPITDPERTPFLWEKSFRFAPQQRYDKPDWDLILRAFYDVAQVNNNQPQTFEHNYTLMGTGVGAELQIKQNFNIRVDWGVALEDIPGQVDAGSNRFHISSTILY